MAFYRQTAEAIVLNVLVQPRASRNQIAGLHGEALKLRLTAPPVEGAANRMCIAFLAEILGLPKSALEIIAGQANRRKQVRIRPAEGQSLEALKKNIDRVSLSP